MPDILTLRPGKSLVAFDDIPLSAVTMISGVITQDEGGWQLVFDGLDGGWTFGGMTATKFSEYFGSLSKVYVSSQLMSTEAGLAVFKEAILRIYYQDFYLRAQRYISWYTISSYHFSCAINCGIGGFSTILSGAKTSAKLDFLGVWKEHYFTLFKNSPEKFGADIHGWTNRVWKYLS